MTVRSVVEQQTRLVASEQFKTLAPLTSDMVLLDSGLDSLCFAIIVARLEDELGVDPFSSVEAVEMPVTFGDLVAGYERAAG